MSIPYRGVSSQSITAMSGSVGAAGIRNNGTIAEPQQMSQRVAEAAIEAKASKGGNSAKPAPVTATSARSQAVAETAQGIGRSQCSKAGESHDPDHHAAMRTHCQAEP